jgi:ketosteroid isomerase-like protein
MVRRAPPPAALLASPEDVEQQFYEALQQGNLEALMATWADDEEIACVHPGGLRVTGPAAIRASFEAIFSQGPLNIVPEALRQHQGMGCAVHHLTERISARTPEGVQTGFVLATNVYLKTPQGWRLVAHHASPAAAEGAPAEPASGTLH